MSKERAKKRAEREREAGIKAAAKGSDEERREREQARKAAAGKPAAGKPVKGQPVMTASKSAPKGAAKAPKKSGPRTPAGNKRKNAPVGRADGPLARRRRFRVRLLLVLLLLVNIAAAVIWQNWRISLAVFIVSVITAPLLAALLLRRRK